MDTPTPETPSPVAPPVYANPSGMINVRRRRSTPEEAEASQERIAASPGALQEYFYGHAWGLHPALKVNVSPMTSSPVGCPPGWFAVIDGIGNIIGYADGPLLSKGEARERIHAACQNAQERLSKMTPEERRECGRVAYERIREHAKSGRIDMALVDKAAEEVKALATETDTTIAEACLLINDLAVERSKELQEEWATALAKLEAGGSGKKSPRVRVISLKQVLLLLAISVPVSVAATYLTETPWITWGRDWWVALSAIFAVWMMGDKAAYADTES